MLLFFIFNAGLNIAKPMESFIHSFVTNKNSVIYSLNNNREIFYMTSRHISFKQKKSKKIHICVCERLYMYGPNRKIEKNICFFFIYRLCSIRLFFIYMHELPNLRWFCSIDCFGWFWSSSSMWNRKMKLKLLDTKIRKIAERIELNKNNLIAHFIWCVDGILYIRIHATVQLLFWHDFFLKFFDSFFFF